MTRLVGRKFLGKIFPSGARSEDPDDPLEDHAKILGRTPGALLLFGAPNDGLDEFPLLIPNLHGRILQRRKSKFREIIDIVFPGNVGGDSALWNVWYRIKYNI